MPGKKAAYAQIYNTLRNTIYSGKLKPGDALPSESSFCKKYRVSRETVRKALVMLESERLIFSRPKVGYFVSIPNQGDIIVHGAEEDEEINLCYKDVTGIIADEEFQKILGSDLGQRIIVFSQLIIGQGKRIIAYEKKYVPYRKAYPSVESEMRYAVLPDMTLSKVACYDYYTKVSVSAVLADVEVAEALGCRDGDPVLLTEQIYTLQNGKVIGYSKQFRCQENKLYGISGHKK